MIANSVRLASLCLIIVQCPVMAQTWPAGISYPSDFPPLPNSNVSVVGSGTLASPLSAAYTDPQGNKIEYDWKDGTLNSASFRMHRRCTYIMTANEGLLLNTIEGVDAKKSTHSDSPTTGGGLDGREEEELFHTVFGYVSQATAGGNVEAIDSNQKSDAWRKVEYDFNISSAKIRTYSERVQKPTQANPTLPELSETFFVQFAYTPNGWSIYRSFDESDVDLSESDIWPNSGGGGSATIQPWPLPNCITLSHYASPSVLFEQSAYVHENNIFSFYYWGFPDWAMP